MLSLVSHQLSPFWKHLPSTWAVFCFSAVAWPSSSGSWLSWAESVQVNVAVKSKTDNQRIVLQASAAITMTIGKSIPSIKCGTFLTDASVSSSSSVASVSEPFSARNCSEKVHI